MYVAGCTEVICWSKHWPCRFPQHGPGKQHERPIVLAEWQREIVETLPEPFVRGLIHSDGCRGMNRVHVNRGLYAYPRYLGRTVTRPTHGARTT